MNFSFIVAVFIGGGLGSLCRYLVSVLVMRSGEQIFPWATLTANVLSCMIMALGLYFFAERIPNGSWQRTFLLVGFCGGFSTFSTFSLENFGLIKGGHYGFLTMNVMLSVVLCILVFYTLYRAETA